MVHNRIQHTQKEYGLRPEAREFPMMCVVSFSYVCNATCPNCPYTLSEIRNSYKDKRFIGEETFKIIADQCGEYGAYIRITGGGEPMLHPYAVELIEYAKKVGAKIGLITNGSKFNEENSLRLLKAGIDAIEFSVDAGDAETYNIVRKGLNWDTLVENVERMIYLRNKLKSNTKIIASAIHQKGVDIDKAETFWRKRVDNFQKRKFLTWGMGDTSQSADPTPYLNPSENIPCPFIFERLNIDSRGNVMVCGYDIAGHTNLGNIHEKSIREIWLGTEFEAYREAHLSKKEIEIEPCKDCSDRKYRTWTYNYWKLVSDAEKVRKSRVDE